MTNQWVCMTSSSEYSFIYDLGNLSRRTTFVRKPLILGLMETVIIALDEDKDSMAAGTKLLKWIDAYSGAPGTARSCWVGEKKRLVCMSWRNAETSDEDE
jgi:hypothetical protein